MEELLSYKFILAEISKRKLKKVILSEYKELMINREGKWVLDDYILADSSQINKETNNTFFTLNEIFEKFKVKYCGMKITHLGINSSKVVLKIDIHAKIPCLNKNPYIIAYVFQNSYSSKNENIIWKKLKKPIHILGNLKKVNKIIN